MKLKWRLQSSSAMRSIEKNLNMDKDYVRKNTQCPGIIVIKELSIA